MTLRFRACLAAALVASTLAAGAASAEALVNVQADRRFEKEAPVPSGIRVGPSIGDVRPEIYPTAVVYKDHEWQVVIKGKTYYVGQDICEWRIMAIAPGLIDVQHGVLAWKLPVPAVVTPPAPR